MKKHVSRLLLFVLFASLTIALFAFPSFAAEGDDTPELSGPGVINGQMFLKIDGIEGESKDTKHDKWIDIVELSHASLQSVQTGSPDAAGRGIFEPIVFKHVVDKATPKLHEATMKGSHIKNAEFHLCCMIAGKQEVVYKVKFEGLKIVKSEVNAVDLGGGKVQYIETVHFLCNKQTWTETAVGLDNALGGNTEACYDQSKKCLTNEEGEEVYEENGGAVTPETNGEAPISGVLLAVVIIVCVALGCATAVTIVVIRKKKPEQAPAVTPNPPTDDSQNG